MARDHARIRLDIWADDDFRALSSGAQWLYLYLVSSPALSFCGVSDWRPARIAAVTLDLTAHDVEMYAAELESTKEHDPLIVVDRDSEEVLVRSFMKHDGLMKQPNLTTAMVNAYGGTASSVLRAVIIGQLVALKGTHPEFRGWSKVTPGMLRRAAMTPAEAVSLLPPNPSIDPSVDPSEEVA
jgi:hypothetical protein